MHLYPQEIILHLQIVCFLQMNINTSYRTLEFATFNRDHTRARPDFSAGEHLLRNSAIMLFPKFEIKV